MICGLSLSEILKRMKCDTSSPLFVSPELSSVIVSPELSSVIVSPELSSVRDYVITHSVRSM